MSCHVVMCDVYSETLDVKHQQVNDAINKGATVCHAVYVGVTVEQHCCLASLYKRLLQKAVYHVIAGHYFYYCPAVPIM